MATLLDMQTQCPELTKYLDEVPDNYVYDRSGVVSENDLLDYQTTLADMIDSYEKSKSLNKK